METTIKRTWLMSMLAIVLMSCFALASCGSDDKDEPQEQTPQEQIVGKWICYEDAYGEPWDEPLEVKFESDGTGYEWFQDEPFAHRLRFEYTATSSKLRIEDEDGDTYIISYKISNKGKSLTLLGWDDDDMQELYFERQ